MKRLLATTALLVALGQGAAAQEYVPDPNAKQGGAITVTYNSDVSTLDPAIGYDLQNWSMINSLFDGLMDYVPGTTEVRPGLAERYEMTPDGLTYTFYLRPGVKFHNGREMTADDVKYSLDRVTNPATQSPGAWFFAAIEGFDAWQGGTATDLSGVTVVDPLTVQIKLSRPNATFLQVMALNFAGVVPKEAVTEDFGRNPVGTGAFKLAEWTIGQRVVLERNADYWREGLPYLDSVTFEVGQAPVVALLRLQNGEVDLLGDGIPPANFVEVMGDPAQADRVSIGGQLHTAYVTMNVNIAPFDNVLVRRAVNMAINKDRIVQVINGRAKPANQVLPPLMPGYDPEFEGYAFDPEAAKALLAEAGLPDGFETDLYVSNTDPNPRIAQAIQQDLANIGIKVRLQSLDTANVIAAGGTKDGAPMIWSGGIGWVADFPDPTTFYGTILGCGGAVEGGWNWSWYCNADLDAKAVEADSMADPSQNDARLALWREIYAGVMADAPWVPIYNEETYSLKSPRVGGADGLFVDPVSIPVNYDYVYVTDVQ